MHAFRIEKGKDVFYRINDFPLNVNELLVFINNAIKEGENRLEACKEKQNKAAAAGKETYKLDLKKIVREVFELHSINQELREYQTLRRNIILLYPKLDLPQIIRLTLTEIGALASGNQSILSFLERLKAALD